MANDYFKFKQFTVSQGRSAMKVSTDACIQGAICVDFIKKNNLTEIQNSLDIGCGTNLLTLMIRQEIALKQCVSVEIDIDAYQDALENTRNSPWSAVIEVVNSDINIVEFKPHYFDLIITNPPFFERSLKNTSNTRTQARHTDSLNFEQLSALIYSNLSKSGIACIMLPPQEWISFCKHLPAKISIIHEVTIQPTQNKPPNRIIGFLSLAEFTLSNKVDNFIIYNEDKSYTDSFIDIMKPYYLHL